MYVNSYNPDAPIPAVGSAWIWEPDFAHAREIIRVTEVIWNGEEWWIRTESVDDPDRVHLNDLGRFYEACVPYGPPRLRAMFA